MFCGVSIGIVTNTKDPDGLGRVRLKLPWLSDEIETDWARLAVPMAGSSRGMFFPPEVNDEVLVAFEQGSPQRPYVVGALWNGVDKPPEANQDGKNDLRMIKSRSGHLIRLVDTDGAEKIEIIDGQGVTKIVLNTADRSLTITAAADVIVQAENGTLSLKGKSVKIAATADLSIEAGTTAELNANTELKLKAALINLN
jgi:uncharacterized protein involved in type VI secretion and phage assembly